MRQCYLSQKESLRVQVNKIKGFELPEAFPRTGTNQGQHKVNTLFKKKGKADGFKTRFSIAAAVVVDEEKRSAWSCVKLRRKNTAKSGV